MSKSFSVKYHAAIDTYRAAKANAAAARVIANAAQAKAWKADVDYAITVYAVEAARSTDDADVVDAAITKVNIANAKVTTAAAAFDKANATAVEAETNYNAAEAAVDEAFDLIAKIRYFEPKQENEE